MSEWQPARIRIVHDIAPEATEAIPDELLAEWNGRIVRIRPLSISQMGRSLRDYREDGCDGQKFYEIHPDDVVDGCGQVACEHEILTD